MSALVEVTDNKVNHSAGCGLEIPWNIFFNQIYTLRDLKLLARTKREYLFSFLLKCRCVDHVVHYMSMHTTTLHRLLLFYGQSVGMESYFLRTLLTFATSADSYWRVE